MAKGNRRLRGGVGDDPAGRGGIADQLFAAREGISTRDQVRRAEAGMGEDDVLPPTPENRAIETFGTVRESLAQTLATNVNDNAKRKELEAAIDSMLQLIDEGDPARIAPDEVERYGQVVRAYQDAFAAQTPQQQQAIMKLVAERGLNRLADFHTVFTGPFAKAGADMVAKQTAQPGVRQARSTAMDMFGDEDEYLEMMRQSGVSSPRPYFDTRRGRSQDAILGVLMDEYGLDPSDVAAAGVGDAALPAFDPGEGVFANRGEYPVRERLSTYIGDVANSARMRYGGKEEIDKFSIASELLDPYHAIQAKNDAIIMGGGEPAAPFLTDARGELPYNAIRTSFDNNLTDDDVAAQMRTAKEKLRDELHNRAFGRPAEYENVETVLGALIDPAVKMDEAIPQASIDTTFPLERFAPWIDGTTQQAIDGKVVRAGFLADQILDTIISQTEIAAEAPHIRAAIKERLAPQVEAAIQARREAGIEPTKRYNRNPAGMRLLEQEGAVVPQATPRPAAQPSRILEEAKERLRRAAGPQPNDMGFSNPQRLPPFMASAMPNRMLAGLLS